LTTLGILKKKIKTVESSAGKGEVLWAFGRKAGSGDGCSRSSGKESKKGRRERERINKPAIVYNDREGNKPQMTPRSKPSRANSTSVDLVKRRLQRGGKIEGIGEIGWG